MRSVILTGAEMRHSFVRKAIASHEAVDVVRSYCESDEKSLENVVLAQNSKKDFRLQHLFARKRSEEDFFLAFAKLAPDESSPVFIPKNSINDEEYVAEIANLQPSLLVAYGCSIIRQPMLTKFRKKFLNVHLGLSPYYRGGGTNFWPLVEGKPEYVGATFMYIDEGIDTGEIIHQIRARIYPDDTPHSIGNRLIRDVAVVYPEIIANFENLGTVAQLPIPDDVRVCRQKDFSEQAVRDLYDRFEAGLVERYLAEEEERCDAVPIVRNPAIAPVERILDLP